MIVPYRNGLCAEQVEASRFILAQVSLKKICKNNNIPMTTIYNVLRDNSSRIDLLKQVLDLAVTEINERKKLLNSIPSKL